MTFRNPGGASPDAPLCPRLAYATCERHAGEGPAPCTAVPRSEPIAPERRLARMMVRDRSEGDLRRLVERLEDLLIRAAIEAQPSLRRAARALGISRSTLWRRLRRSQCRR